MRHKLGSAVLIVNLLAGAAGAAPQHEIKNLTITWQKPGQKIEVKLIPYVSLAPTDSLRAISPHRNLNPEKKVSDWKGIFFKRLLAPYAAHLKSDSEVSIVGSDAYQAQVTLSDLTDFGGMLAIEKDDKKLNAHTGGPQTIFPNLDPKLPEDLKFEGFGVWYVSAFVLGKLSPVILVREGGRERELDLTSVKKPSVRRSPTYFPVGHSISLRQRKFSDGLRFTNLTFKKFDDFMREISPTTEKVSVETYYGETIPLSNFQNYEIIYQWDGKEILPKFGGPVQICSQGGVPNCIFYVRRLVL